MRDEARRVPIKAVARGASWLVGMTGLLLIATAAGAQTAAPAPAPDFDLLRALQLKGKAAPAPAFVTESRPRTEGDFIPVHTPHAERPDKVMSAAEVAAATAQLDGERERQQRRAGKTPAVVPLKPPAGAKTTKR